MDRIEFRPISVFRADAKYAYDARRQASVDTLNSRGVIELLSEQNFEQALDSLEGFERVWLIYAFHHNQDWNPMVMPPRGPRVKRGVFATRAPYRPNPIGMSCVRLLEVLPSQRRVVVEGHDLLDGTPILDIKPYVPYADAFPEAKTGWLESVDALSAKWQVAFCAGAGERLAWLEEAGQVNLRGFVIGQLEFDPLDHKRKRVTTKANLHTLAYRTWRVDFTVNPEQQVLNVQSITSGYSSTDLLSEDDRYNDKAIHRRFVRHFHCEQSAISYIDPV